MFVGTDFTRGGRSRLAYCWVGLAPGGWHRTDGFPSLKLNKRRLANDRLTICFCRPRPRSVGFVVAAAAEHLRYTAIEYD
jgi:hypothetical protein